MLKIEYLWTVVQLVLKINNKKTASSKCRCMLKCCNFDKIQYATAYLRIHVQCETVFWQNSVLKFHAYSESSITGILK